MNGGFSLGFILNVDGHLHGNFVGHLPIPPFDKLDVSKVVVHVR